jgi:CRP/FNR family transcriptional regulator
MTTPSLELLENSLIFRKLSSQDLADLARLTLSKTLAEGEFLALQGNIWPYLLLLNNGVLKTHKVSPQGRSLGAFRLLAGQLFCSPSLIDGGPLPATLEGGEDCELFLWHKDQILPYLERNNEALWDLSALLVQRMRYASEIVEDLAFHPVANRVARLLLKQHQQTGDDLVDRNLTLDEMASMIGTTPVMVCKILSQFADQGMIKVSRTEIEFVNLEDLENLINKN